MWQECASDKGQETGDSIMYSVRIEDSFSAAHKLKGYDGDCENLHGHNWQVVVEVCGEKLGAEGHLIDFRDLRGMLKEITDELDHKMLNELPAFNDVNPTSENVACHIHKELTARLKQHTGVALSFVRVYESQGSSAAYSE